MDQSSIGKLGNKVDESTSGNKVSRDQGAGAAGRPASIGPGDTVELTDGARLLERLKEAERVSQMIGGMMRAVSAKL